MTELKALMKKKEKESEESKFGDSGLSHENTDPEAEIRSYHERNVQTLIRPQLTNPKIFWSKSEDEDFSWDPKSKNVRNALVEEKVITNVFKPIRSEISPEVGASKPGGKTGSRKKDDLGGGKSGKSIHESLRIQKIKRRTSLPFFWEEKTKEEVVPAFEKVKTYDISYYSSIMKKLTQEGTDYYSSSKKMSSDQPGTVRSASDECIYGERPPEGGQDPEVKRTNAKRPDRISVTEPSSPLATDYSSDVHRKLSSFDSEMDSESTGSDTLVVEMKKSKSFAEDKDGGSNLKSKSKKLSGVDVRKPSLSSASSCDSAYATRYLRKTTKTKRKSMENYSSKSQGYVRQVKKHSRRSENSERIEKEEKGFRRGPDLGNVMRERSQSWNRDEKKEESSGKINPDVFQHLLDVLMQKNRTEVAEENWKESFSKSLPRNSSRRSKDPRYEKDCLRILEALGGEDTWGKKQQRKNDLSENERVRKPGTDVDVTYRRRRKTDGMERSRTKSGHSGGDSGFRQKNEMEAISKERNARTKTGQKTAEEECVIRIEDKKLWIEICKAVEKMDAKGKKIKKCA